MRSGPSGFWGSGLACAGERAVGRQSYALDCYLNRGGRVWKPASRITAKARASGSEHLPQHVYGRAVVGEPRGSPVCDSGLPTLSCARSPVWKRVSGGSLVSGDSSRICGVAITVISEDGIASRVPSFTCGPSRRLKLYGFSQCGNRTSNLNVTSRATRMNPVAIKTL